MSRLVIVSRHPAAIEFIADHLSRGRYSYAPNDGSVCVYEDDGNGNRSPEFYRVPILASATADDVRGKIVYGNLPLHLAALALQVCAVEFTGPAPRGAEYTLGDMIAAGATIRAYKVKDVTFDEASK